MSEQMQTQPVNPFGDTGSSVIVATAGAVASHAREEYELKALFSVAQHLGRDERAAWESIMAACERPGFVTHPNGDPRALYVFPRAGKAISGPSVVMARELMRHWRGLLVDSPRIVEMNDDEVHIRAVCIDLVNCSRTSMEKKFARLIQRKVDGVTRWVSPDERDLDMLINRHAATLERNVILRHIPSDVTDAAVFKVRQIMDNEAQGDLGKNRKDVTDKLLSAFKPLGVTKEMIEEAISRKITEMSAAQLTDLRGTYRSIMDGHTGVGDHFRGMKGMTATAAATDQLNTELARAQAAPQAGGATSEGSPTQETAQAPGAPPAAPASAQGETLAPGEESFELIELCTRLEVQLKLKPKELADYRVAHGGGHTLPLLSVDQLKGYFQHLNHVTSA